MPNLNHFRDFTYVVGIDIAKSVFQVHSCNTQTGEIQNVPIKRAKLLEHFVNRGKCLIGMEACGSSQYWAREFQKLGHTVRLMDPKRVKPNVRHNKSDRADAEGIYWALVNGVQAVAVRNNIEQDIHTLLTMRSRLMTLQTGNINHVRGLLAEYGQVMPKSPAQFLKHVSDSINNLEVEVDSLVIDMFRSLVEQIKAGEEKLRELDREITKLAKQTKHADHFLTVPGVGLVIMANLCVILANPSTFASGRQFAAFVGLVPMHTGSGGKTINTSIPYRCDKRLRALFVEGAQAVARSKHPADWVKNILARKPKKVALIAIANRMARQCWAVAHYGQPWRDTSIATAA